MSIFKVSLCCMRGEATHNGAPRRDVDMRPVLAVVPLEWSSACSALAPVNQRGFPTAMITYKNLVLGSIELNPPTSLSSVFRTIL